MNGLHVLKLSLSVGIGIQVNSFKKSQIKSKKTKSAKILVLENELTSEFTTYHLMIFLHNYSSRFFERRVYTLIFLSFCCAFGLYFHLPVR